jgi:hypothetical protein
MTEDEKHDCQVYYVLCPDNPHHFILEDPAHPAWEKTPPKSPCKTHCYLCGEKYVVNVAQPWKIGYASSKERDQRWSLTEPLPVPRQTTQGQRAGLNLIRKKT